MAKQRRAATFTSFLPLALMAFTAIGLLAVVGVSLAWLSGAFATDDPEPVDRTGQLAFPALARPVAAFEKLTRDDFINPQTGQLHVIWLSESNASVALRDMGEVIGRVLSRDKQAGMVLTEADLMERGTRPGLAAGVPPGKLAVTIPADEVTGLDQLRNGDRFDLLVALPKRDDVEQISNTEPAVLFGGIKPPSLRVGQLSRQHGVKRLVTNAMLVTLFTKTERSTTGPRGLTVPPQSSRSRTKTAETETVVAELAVDPEEIGPLTQAISLDTPLTCVLRSGQPGANEDDEFSAEGMVPVVTTAKTVSAFSALTDENLIDEGTGQLHVYYFPAEKVAETWITDPTELYGRVVSRNLRRGSLITEEDLLPPGTRPGISAGLPSDMAAISIEKEKIKGFEKLVVGDRFSILTRVPEAVEANLPSINWATLHGGQLSEDDARVADMVRTGIREIAQDAVYLSDPDDATVVIGVSRQEVAKLAQLLRDESELFVVANSSRESDSPASKSGSNLSAAAASRVDGRWDFVSQIASNSESQDASDRSNTVPIPVLVRDVPAFRKLTIDDFLDPASGQIRLLYFAPENVDDVWQTDVRELIDRVTLRSLDSGRVVGSDDLAPPGTPEGPAVGLPPGTRGVTVNSAQVEGLIGIAEGSVFDLMTGGGVSVSALADSARRSLSGPDAIQESGKLPTGKVSNARVIATGVTLLADLGETTITVARRGAPQQLQTRTRLVPDGSTITEEVLEEPAISSEQQTVERFVLAVPEAAAQSVVGMLDVQNPLAVSLRPLNANASETGIKRDDSQSPNLVRAVIQEHVRGDEISTEVFLTDRPEATRLSSSPDATAQHGGEG